jgi:hypothetical protein
MTDIPCIESYLIMISPGIQNNPVSQDSLSSALINDLIYHNGGDSTQWQFR